MSDLDEAQECLLAAGGLPSDIGTRPADWYWRRAAKLWRAKADSVHAEVEKLRKLLRYHRFCDCDAAQVISCNQCGAVCEIPIAVARTALSERHGENQHG